MSELEWYFRLIYLEFLICPFVAWVLFRFPAPYGKHASYGWGPGINKRLAWFLMEATSLFVFGAIYFLGKWPSNPISTIFLVLWLLHYFDRTVIHSLRMSNSSNTPILLVVFGVIFNGVNAYLNARFLTYFGREYPLEWLWSGYFISGMCIFVIGCSINRHADHQLLRLKQFGMYQIPTGSLFNYIASPNYFGEILQWLGWAIAGCSLPGLAFAFFTASNLIPRAYAHLKWYGARETGYLRTHKAIIPFVL